jgi:hypothetical protein
MRLRERNGEQNVYLNPFGTYFGDQFSHLPDGSGVARRLTMSVAAHLRSTAPGFNGNELKFRMMLAPYLGDRPGGEIVADAATFSLPPGVIAGGGLERDPEHEEEESEIVKEHGLDACEGWEYGDFLESRNREKRVKGMIPRRGRPEAPAGLLLKVFAESVGVRRRR